MTDQEPITADPNAITRLGDLAVSVAFLADGSTRVEIIDRRRKVEVVSLTPSEAAAVARVMSARAAAVDGDHRG